MVQKRPSRATQLKPKELQEIFRLIGESAADMIAVVDTTGQRLYNNPAYERVLGYSPGELAITNSLEQIHAEDRQRVREAAEEAGQTGVGRKVEYRFRHKDGTWRILESSASVIRNPQGEPDKFVVVNRDITERREAEKTLRESRSRQTQKMEALGRLSGGIAHDFNNLLTVIIGQSEVLEANLGRNDPLRRGALEIKKAAEHAAALTRQLLAFSRQQEQEPKVLDLNAVVTDVENMLRRLIGEDIELTTLLDPKLGPTLADEGQIVQVIMNLAANARDAMSRGGKLTIETANAELASTSHAFQDSEQEKPRSVVRLSVTDTGVGMDTETQSRMFEPFFTTKQPTRGTGLGLATVYGIVEQSGGHIAVYSEVGKGTTFNVYLSRIDEGIATPALKMRESQAPQPSETILLVEDEEPIRDVTRLLLVQSGYDVLEASSGEQCLDVAQEHKGHIHLLLTDVVMPGMSGPALAERFAASRPKTKVLYMSGYADDVIKRHSLLSCGVFLLEKPFTRAELLGRVRAVLNIAGA
jgi:two-component system cell cycle sensor histidine kinase/response regulator CckA